VAGHAVVCTGDGRPDPALVVSARGADAFIAEAAHPEVMAADDDA
jgi:ribonuclease BN (tRNA processing enzyme)